MDIVSLFEDAIGKEKILSNIADLYAYGFDASIHHAMPDLVIQPGSEEDVIEVIRIAHENSIPVVARGAGTALSGQAIPIRGGIILDMMKMNRIKEVKIENFYCIVEPGVIYGELNRKLSEYGFFFPPSPGSGDVCTIGGMIAMNASGMRAIKYGATRDYVLGLRAVFPPGKAYSLGSRTLKNSSGYQLERLMVGSEGTLGVITEATIKIVPLPEKRAVAVASFDNLYDAGKGVANIIAAGIVPSALEIMDRVCIQAVNKSMNIGLPDVEAILIIEKDGKEAEIREDIKRIAEICRKSNAKDVVFTYDEDEMANLWKGRKGVLPSLSRYGKNRISVSLADDMCVPISKIPDAVKAFQEIAAEYDIIIGTYGHAGDGNLHTKILIDPTRQEEWKKAEKVVDEIYKVVHKLGGIASGEHGIGISKAPWMNGEAIELMEKIKKVIDPRNIMNPGKMMEWKGSIIKNLRYR